MRKLLFISILTAHYLLGESAKAEEFSFVVIPDTQSYTISAKNMFHMNEQMKWIKDNKSKENIVFISHVGDLIENYPNDFDNFIDKVTRKLRINNFCTSNIFSSSNKIKTRWERASNSLDILEKPSVKIPYSIIPGNHDYDCATLNYNIKGVGLKSFKKYFGKDRYVGKNWFLGSDKSNINMGQKFTANGKKYIHIGLEFLASDKAIEYAQNLIIANPRIPIIISTHYYLNRESCDECWGFGDNNYSTGTNSPKQLYEKLIEPNPQIFLVFSGHVNGERFNVSKTSMGNTVNQIKASYQSDPQGGNGWLKILKFKPSESKLSVKTFSPTFNLKDNKGVDRSKDSKVNLTIDLDINKIHNYLESHKVLHFRNGQSTLAGSNYDETIDKTISRENKLLKKIEDLTNGKGNVLIGGKGNKRQGLLKFKNIIGFSTNQVKPNTKIKKAILTLTSEGIDRKKGVISVHQMKKAWDHNTSWQDINDGDEIGIVTSIVPPFNIKGTNSGTRSFDVTDSVQSWLDGSSNQGWLFNAKNNSFANFRSSKWKGISERPMLTIIYNDNI